MKRKRNNDMWIQKREVLRLSGQSNQFYYRFNDCCGGSTPCIEHGGSGACTRKKGKWAKEERDHFYEQYARYGTSVPWGRFATEIPTRVGYTCNQFYIKLTRSVTTIQRYSRGYLVRKHNYRQLGENRRQNALQQPVPPPYPIPPLEASHPIANEVETGWVYCLSNKYFRQEKHVLGKPLTYLPLLKIGFTDVDPRERARQLYTTGVPGPFRVEFAKCIRATSRRKREEKERILHNLLDNYRVNGMREFFNVPTEELKNYFKLLANDEWYADAVWCGE